MKASTYNSLSCKIYLAFYPRYAIIFLANKSADEVVSLVRIWCLMMDYARETAFLEERV